MSCIWSSSRASVNHGSTRSTRPITVHERTAICKSQLERIIENPGNTRGGGTSFWSLIRRRTIPGFSFICNAGYYYPTLRYSTNYERVCHAEHFWRQNRSSETQTGSHFSLFGNYSPTSIKRPPIKRPPSIKRPLSKVPIYLSVNCCI